MAVISRLPDWRLNYQVAAVGAYATILVQSIQLILRGFEYSSLLSISILTNASAVLIAGFGGASPTPFAILRICLTSLFLLCALILPENEDYDGTYAILCSVAHLTYQLALRVYGRSSVGFLPHYEKGANTNEESPESCLHTPPTDYNHDPKFSGSIRIFFGDTFCLEGAMVPVTILGTVMTYRVFDFDLGFGLVFAFMSAFLSCIIVFFVNSARIRSRRMDTQKSIQLLVSLLLVIGTFCFVLFTTLDFQDIEFSWWRIGFGVAWFLFLFRTTYFACRFLTHATLFPCATCSQREAGTHGPMTQEASTGCIWDDYITLPALEQGTEHTSGEPATFLIKRQKDVDLVERFWLNGQEWFQVSPRSFVIFLVSCIALASFSGGALNSEGSFASIGNPISKNIAFYVTMAFTFISTGHTAAGESPELMFVPLKHSFPGWKSIVRAIIITILIHLYFIFVAPADPLTIFVTPIACMILAPLLLAGISRPLKCTVQHCNSEPGTEEKTSSVSSDELSSSTTTNRTIDSTLVYSSSRIRSFDLRVLLLGLSIALFDVLYDQYEDEAFFTRWSVNALLCMSVTILWLYLENAVPRSQDLEPGILSLAVAALVGNFGLVISRDAFGAYDSERGDGNSPHETPISKNVIHSNPIFIAFCYTTLVSMVVVNRRLVHTTNRALSPTKGSAPMKDHLLFGLDVNISQFKFAWQLRNSRATVSLVFMMLASFLGDNWPLDMKTTIASLLLFVLIVGFQIHPSCDNLDEKTSLPHIAALGFSTLTTILAVGLNHYGILHALLSEPNSDWKAGSWSALVFYQLFLAISLRLERRGCSTRPKYVNEPPREDLQNEEKALAQEGEKQRVLDATTED